MAGEKTEESAVSHESGKGKCLGERPRLNQGLCRHHRAQVGGFEGPVTQVPKVMTSEGGVSPASTHLQHLGKSKVLLKKKRRSDTSGLPGSWGRSR